MKHRLLRYPAFVAVAIACGMSNPAPANPSGPTVVSGNATFSASGPTLTVANTPGAIINWQSFSIGAGELTRFDQQSAASAVLNRVITADPSTILGALQSNGRIFLVNPGGIVFGAGARIDAAGLIASTLNISDADFIAGRLRFAGAAGAGPVVNNGTIATFGDAASPVYLIGPLVLNGGVITSPGGEVVLAAGTSVEIVDPGTPNISVQITAPGNQALNLGSILAATGRVNIFAGLVRQLGVVQADTLAVSQDGTIVLEAANGATAGTTTPVTGATPGLAPRALTDNPATALGPVTPSQLSGETLSTTTAGGTSAIVPGDTATFSSTVPTLMTGVPTFTSSVPTLITGVPTFTSPAPTTAPVVTQSLSPAPSFFTTPTFGTTTTTAPFAATIPLQ